MAQLRDDYEDFVQRDAEIVVMCPEGQSAVGRYWKKEGLPFSGIPDPTHKLAKMYGQEVKLLKMGRMPALMVIDKMGRLRYQHYAGAMWDIPDNTKILGELDKLNDNS